MEVAAIILPREESRGTDLHLRSTAVVSLRALAHTSLYAPGPSMPASASPKLRTHGCSYRPYCPRHTHEKQPAITHTHNEPMSQTRAELRATKDTHARRRDQTSPNRGKQVCPKRPIGRTNRSQMKARQEAETEAAVGLQLVIRYLCLVHEFFIHQRRPNRRHEITKRHSTRG